MPRLSLWRSNHSNDYKFFDRRMSEMFTIGGTDINVHKYLGTNEQNLSKTTSATQPSPGTVLEFSNTSAINVGNYIVGPSLPDGTKVASKTLANITLTSSTVSAVSSGTSFSFYNDATQPSYVNQSAKNIQDLLFLENRDRKYDSSIYSMRGIYRVNDNDFDLSQFGLFLTSDTLFIVLHLNDMVETLGRKVMVGDVIELPHLKDFYPLDEDDTIPAALKRYYVVQDATRAAEGFAPTWYGHLWRIKVQPLVDSQEYKDIIDNITAGENTDTTLSDLLSTYNNYLNVNEKIIEQAENEVPESGYDTSNLYTVGVNENGLPGDPVGLDASDATEDASESNTDVTASYTSPSAKVQGYLTGDGYAPNGEIIRSGIEFPAGPSTGTYFLRIDYKPNRLFRFDGRRWIKIEDAVRTSLTPGLENTTQRSGFINNPNARYSGALGWDAIRVSNVYTPAANAHTVSFTLSTQTVVTKTPYSSSYGVKSTLNGVTVPTATADSSGNIAFTISGTYTLTTDDLLEYTVYRVVENERVSLSDALKPRADN